MLATEVRAVHGRLDGVASAPMMRAAIETDAATVADMVADGQLIYPRRGETIELVQTGAQHKRLLRLPEVAPSAPSIIAPGTPATRLTVEAGRLVVIATAPITSRGARVAGTLAIAAAIDLSLIERLVAQDARTAILVGLDQPLVLAGPPTAAAGIPVILPIALDGELGRRPLQLVATIGAAPGGKTLHALRLASFGLAALLASIALGWFVHGGRR
jgi:hypothetical protein